MKTQRTGRLWLPLTLAAAGVVMMAAGALRGEAAGNFYKCGDRTETPHYLAWAKLSCDHPDYHRRQDFGTLRFEE